MSGIKLSTNRLLRAVRPPNPNALNHAVFALTLASIVYVGVLIARVDWQALLILVPAGGTLILLGYWKPMQERFLKQSLNFSHLLQLGLYMFLSQVCLFLVRWLWLLPPDGKDSQLFYVLVMVAGGVGLMAVRALLTVWIPRLYQLISTDILLWEQVLLAFNELIAILLLGAVWSGAIVRFLQPDIFSTRINAVYSISLLGMTLFYYLGILLMWFQFWNDLLTRTSVAVILIRVFSPIVLLIVSMVIWFNFTDRADPRTSSLLQSEYINFAILSLAPVLWLLVAVVMVLGYSGSRGIGRLIITENLLSELPTRLRNTLREVSDVNLVLILIVSATLIPVLIVLFGDSGGLVGIARQTILQRGSALVETSEQALAILFIIPFYLLILFVMTLYAWVIWRASLSAERRDALMHELPQGLLIILLITLYLFAVPFTQVFTEGRIPTFERDLGRILAYYFLVPLLLLYIHYFILVRYPYARGQRVWREHQAKTLDRDLQEVERSIQRLNMEVERMDNRWKNATGGTTPVQLENRLTILFRYVQVNGERDDLNMRRADILSKKQELNEINETPQSVSVARLPLRIISIAIPLLFAFQIYQWVILNRGLQDIVNDPSLTFGKFIQILMNNIQF